MPSSISLPRTDNIATFESLIRFLQPLASVESPDEPLIVILASKSFATELRSRHDLISQVATQVLGKQSTVFDSFQTLLAIVDKLPGRLIETEAGTLQTQQNHSPGIEGLCVAISSTRFSGISSDAIDNWSPESSRFTHSLGPETPATLTCFLTPSHEDALRSLHHQQQKDQDVAVGLRTISVQLPLPSTVFENGLKNTLVLSKYERDSKSSEFVETSSKNVRHAQIALPYDSASGSYESILSLPLESLTEAFQVVDCKGNIVRQVRLLDHTSSKAQPASEGLEHAVSKYFVDRGISPHTLAIWALITPRAFLDTNSRLDQRTREQLSQMCLNPSAAIVAAETASNLTTESSILSKLLQAGAKLRRVTSGGGGWGNKAGLLSLDPETAFSIDSSPLDSLELIDGGDVDWLGSGLEPIARPTDLIQFFYTSGELIQKVLDSRTPAVQNLSRSSTAYTFGVVPSTIDDMGLDAQPTGKDLRSQGPQVVMNRFGALSEKGISLRLRSITHEVGKPLVEESETKIDVPFASFDLPSLDEAPTKNAGTTMGIAPTEPRRAVSSKHIVTEPERNAQSPDQSTVVGSTKSLSIRYSNRLPAPNDIPTTSQKRNIPLPFRPEHAASRSKARLLSRHPQVRERVFFVRGPGASEGQPTAISPPEFNAAGKDDICTSASAEEYFWAARKASGRVLADAGSQQESRRWDKLVSEVSGAETVKQGNATMSAAGTGTLKTGPRSKRQKPLTARVKSFLENR